ncbi:30S ribosomal protein S6 [Candidatus Falkowbacteria bacterium]|jgi:small subunit ribosomal protein S6|nr:30S ribosomal protein S6 [Candidatus Falkowbacteria bacterium]
MSKTKAAGTTHYEILFILPNKFTEDEAKKVMDKVGQLITTTGGQLTHNEFWGKKKLAYEIKHNAYGYYGLFEFDLEGKLLAAIDKNLRLSADILRHQIVVKKVKSAEEIARAEAIRAKIDSKKAADKKKEEKEKKASTTEAPAKTKKADDKRVDLKDLDKKLEGILNAKDLI